MKELDFGIRTMTTKELAQVLGVTERTIQNIVLELANILSPVKKNSQGGYLFNCEQVNTIKQEIQKHHNLATRQIDKVKTNIEIIANYKKATEDIIALLQSEIEQQKRQLQEQQPKVDFFDDVAGSKDTIDMRDVATTLNIKNMGRNKIFALLRAKGVLDRYNQPYQKYVDKGFFRTIESMYTTKEGETKINIKTVVFQKGLDFIRGLTKTL